MFERMHNGSEGSFHVSVVERTTSVAQLGELAESLSGLPLTPSESHAASIDLRISMSWSD